MMQRFLGKMNPGWLVGLILIGAASVSGEGIPAAFVDIGYGARPMGMGGAYVALASDAHAVLWNPAGLPFVKGWQVTTMYAKQFNLIPYYMASGAKPVGQDFGVGFGLLSSGDDVWRETTFLLSGGVKLGRWSPALKSMSVGVTAKFRTVSFGNNDDGGVNQITGSATGFGLDAAFRWKFASRWTLGLLFRDAVNGVTYQNETLDKSYNEAVPPALIMGTAFLADDNLVFTLDWDKALSEDTHDRVLAGAEWRLLKMIFLRGGWSQSLDVEPNRKLNFGVGVQYFTPGFGFRLDFAYQTHFLATTPRVSTSFWF